LQTLPPWGMIANGVLYQLPTPELRTCDAGGGAWPTPDVRGFTNHGSLQMLAKVANNKEEYSGMAYRAAQGKKDKLWPTPTCNDAKNNAGPSQCKRSVALNVAVALSVPTPTASGYGSSGARKQLRKMTDEAEARKMGAGNGGQLNPQWVEWLMGFPIGWVNLEPLETRRFRRFLSCFGTLSREKGEEK